MIYILIGMISGIATGIGVGGGTLLIIILTTFLGIEQKIAQSCNLIFFIPTAIISILLNMKDKNLNIKRALPIAISGTIFSTIGSIIAINLNGTILRKIFGIFLIIIAIYEIRNLYIKSKYK